MSSTSITGQKPSHQGFYSTLLRHAIRAIVRPTHRDVPIHPLRSFVALPRVFDFVSLVMQAADHRRTKQITESFGADDDHHRTVQSYNAGVTLSKVFAVTRRFDALYRQLTVPSGDLSQFELLVVGPRSRPELLAAWCHGFEWSKIFAIDLYSTNPKILVMNMEAMTWPDARFDVVTMANTLSYADDTAKALSEVARVLRPGGRFVFTTAYDPADTDWKGSSVSASMIIDELRALGMEAQVVQSTDKTNAIGNRQTSHFIMARKKAVGETRVDPYGM